MTPVVYGIHLALDSAVDSLNLENSQSLARSLAQRFRAAGQELFLVGGSIRDDLLGEMDTDLDFATDAFPDRTAAIVEGCGAIYRVGERFGTIGLALDGYRAEITTYRSEEKYAAGSRKPEVRFGRTLLEDLSRRDFTINAMARDPLTEELIDPLHGVQDLTAGIIRAVGSPKDRFLEDPLRLLRAVRFAARFNFVIEPDTREALSETAPALETISRERIRDEYGKTLTGPNAVRGLTLLRDTGLLAHSVPQLLELTAMADHGPRHPLSLWEHVMRVVAGVPPLLSLRWAALLHDIAKPATRIVEPDGRPRFFHHEEVGARMAREILTSLRYGSDVVAAVALLVETHMQFHAYTPDWSDGAVRRLMLRLGPLMEEAFSLVRADAAGHSLTGVSANGPKMDDLERRVRRFAEGVTESLKSPLTGDELMRRYARPPGPWIREVKDRLLHEVIEGNMAAEDREAAWRLADEVVTAQP